MKSDSNGAASLTPPAAYDASRLNALRHGLLSQFTVLPWEDPAEYAALRDALEDEHQPAGPTESHLVEELAGVLWRKRRLRLAEAASFHRGLHATTDTYSKTAASALVTTRNRSKIDVAQALQMTSIDAQRELANLKLDQDMTLCAIAILRKGAAEAFAAALAALDESTRESWKDQLTWDPAEYEAGEQPYTADTPNLLRYLETAILPWYDECRAELQAGPLVRTQALGEALDPDKLERLGRYEVHLDRKFARTLSTLLRLQSLRRTLPARDTA